jgi:Flp pilus assembly protein CpaB
MLVAGLVAMLLNYHVLRASDDATPVALLQQDVAAGQVLPAGQLRFVEVTAGDDVLSGLVTRDKLPAIAGSVAGADLSAGSVLRLADLRPAAAPAGGRAMSIPVQPEHAVAGHLERGDRVDVVEVRDGQAVYLLIGAPVLDVASPEVRAGIAAGRTFSITVAVDDEQALRLALAIRESHIEVLRSTGASAPGVLRTGAQGSR